MPDIFRDIFLAFVRVHILHHAEEGPVYGLEMLEELGRHGYEIGPGTLYPIFHGLERAGYLTSEREPVNGKVRKYYRITPAGSEVLSRLQPRIRELVGEVLKEDAATRPRTLERLDDGESRECFSQPRQALERETAERSGLRPTQASAPST